MESESFALRIPVLADSSLSVRYGSSSWTSARTAAASFFDQIPGSYFEAAALDGAGSWYLYSRICMPLSKPIISLIALQTFIGNWNDFFWAWLVTEDQNLWTLNVALYNISNNAGTKQNALMGLAVVTITPVILLSILFSRQLKQSIAASGVKG